MKFLILLSFVTLNSFAADCFYKLNGVTPVWKGVIKQKFEFLVNGKIETVYKDRRTEIRGNGEKVTASKFYCDCSEQSQCISQLHDYVRKVACKTPPKGRLSLGIVESSGWDVDIINIKEDAVAPKVTHVNSAVEYIKENKSDGVGTMEVLCP